MFTNNWYALWYTSLNVATGGTSSTRENRIPVKTTTGSTRYISGACANYAQDGVKESLVLGNASYVQINSAMQNDGVYFGDGSGVLTSESYRLFGSVITGIAVTSATTATREENTITKNITFTIANNNAQDITIKEIGVIGGSTLAYADMNTSSTSKYSDRFLLEHTLLDEPVTIPAGGVGQVTYTITFNIA